MALVICSGSGKKTKVMFKTRFFSHRKIPVIHLLNADFFSGKKSISSKINYTTLVFVSKFGIKETLTNK
jgi:hypothetical protein